MSFSTLSGASAPAVQTDGYAGHLRHRLSRPTIAAIVAAHAGAIVLLASLQPPAPHPVATPALMVRMVAPAAPAPVAEPERKPVVKPQPRPQPVPARPVPQRLAAQAPAASSSETVEVAKPVPPAPAAPPAQPPAAPPSPAPVVSAPRFDAGYLANPAPAYPPMSRRLGEEGKVMLHVFVEADGRPGQIEVRTGSGSSRLDQAALDAVRRWKFVPARRGEEAVGAWVFVPIVFNLKG